MSNEFFDEWREKGLPAAADFLVRSHEEVGNPELSPKIKVLAMLGGLGCIFLSDKIKGHKNKDPDHAEQRQFTTRDKILGAAALAAAGGLLLATCYDEGQETAGEDVDIVVFKTPTESTADSWEGGLTTTAGESGDGYYVQGEQEDSDDLALPEPSKYHPRPYLTPSELRELPSTAFDEPTEGFTTSEDPDIYS